MLFETIQCPGHYIIPEGENVIPANSPFDDMPDFFSGEHDEFLTLSDSEFLDETFDASLVKNTEDLMDMTEVDFDSFIKEKESPANQIKECMESMIQTIEIEEMPELDLGPPALDRTPSLEPIEQDDLESSLTTGLEGATRDENFDCSMFDSEESAEESEDSDATDTDVSDNEEPEPSDSELVEAQERIDELESIKEQQELEITHIREQLERKRQRSELVEEEYERPVKMRKFTTDRRGCPFCPFEQSTSGYDMRCLKDHLTNGECCVCTSDMVDTSCTYENLWCREGDSGWDCLNKMGFKDPDNHVDEFLHFKCPKCDFRHFHARKFKRHLAAGYNRGGCGYSKEEAEEIKNQQLKRCANTSIKV